MILHFISVLIFAFASTCSTSRPSVPKAERPPEDDILFPQQSNFINVGNENQLPVEDSYFAKFDHRDLQTLQELEIKIKGKSLVSKSGEVFERHPFKSLYHLEFFDKVEDLRKADHVYAGIEKHILNSPMKEEYRRFLLVWLADFAIFLGSKDMYLLKRLESDMTHRLGAIPSAEFDDIKKRMTMFFSKLSVAEKSGFEAKPSKNILIVTTRGGGGHYSTALAMKEFLEKETKYKPIMFNMDELEKDFEPVLHISGVRSVSSAFNEFSQKEGDSNKFSRYTRIYSKLQLYYPSRLVSMLREAMVREHVFLVLNTCVFSNKTAGASYSLDVPQLFVETDFDFWKPMTDLILWSDPKLSKVTVTAPVRSVFEDLSWRIKQAKYPVSAEITQLADASYDQEKLNRALEKTPTLLPFGYPVRNGIRRFTTDETKEAFKKWRLNEGSKAAMLMMGAQGKKGLDSVVNAIASEPGIEAHLDRIFILVGKNQETKVELEKLLSRFPPKIAGIFEILGLQNAESVSELYNISKFVISKPGGSTTAELLQVAKPIIMFNSNYGEAGNKRMLEAAKLGYNAYSVQAIVNLIMQDKIDEKQELASEFVPLDWKKNLLKAIESFEAQNSKTDL